KFFNLTKEDDVRKFVIRRTVTKEGKQDYTKAPRLQRLVAPQRLPRPRRRGLWRAWGGRPQVLRAAPAAPQPLPDDVRVPAGAN
ncbi:MAG: hypothetical protein L0K42_02235, partial [Acidipropionibacterium jensenii]|uniref:hypothetical protein n=1 Tax=Acidipropionibacterium jensenii TaxID=1749 RepID=UPI0026470361